MNDWLTMDDLIRACHVERAAIVEWVQLGVVRAQGAEPDQWRFAVTDLAEARGIARLTRELELAPYAAALVHDLLRERARLERRVRALERMLGQD
jgi:chaperone modulatory protein CbpM